MTSKLFFQAVAKFALGVLALGALVFVPAGTFHYPRAWLLMGILFLSMFAAGVVLVVKNPELLKKRLNAKEKQREQSAVVKLSALMFAAGFVLAGLGVRFGWPCRWCLARRGPFWSF